jgi:hypothetical protein
LKEKKGRRLQKQERKPDAFPLTLLFPGFRFVCLLSFLFICVGNFLPRTRPTVVQYADNRSKRIEECVDKSHTFYKEKTKDFFRKLYWLG